MTESVGMTVVLLILAIIDIVGNVIVCAIIKRNRDMRYIFILVLFTVEPLHNAHRRPANSHGFAVSLTIFCHFSRSPDKAPNLTVFLEKYFWKEVN